MAKQVRWGILGTGAIAATVAAAMRRSSNGEPAAVASRDLAKAEHFAGARGIPLAYGSYAELISAGKVDAVYIALPNSLHAEWTIAALQAGLPVFCEKPLTPTLAEARAIEEAATAAGLPVAEAFMHRFHPVWDTVEAAVFEGEIGALVSLSASFTFMNKDKKSIVASAELAGGALLDVGCYPVCFARQIIGEEPISAVALRAMASVDTTFSGVLEFPEGVLAQVSCSIAAYETARAEILGTDGLIVVETPWLPDEEGGIFTVQRKGRTRQRFTVGRDIYQREVEDFAAAVLEGRPPRWPLDDALGNVAALDALAQSAATGQRVMVEPITTGRGGVEGA